MTEQNDGLNQLIYENAIRNIEVIGWMLIFLSLAFPIGLCLAFVVAGDADLASRAVLSLLVTISGAVFLYIYCLSALSETVAPRTASMYWLAIALMTIGFLSSCGLVIFRFAG